MDINTILNALLIGAFLIVAYIGLRKAYIAHTLHKLNMLIIELQLDIPVMTREQVEEVREVLDTADGIADQRYIDTARLYLNARERVLNILKD